MADYKSLIDGADAAANPYARLLEQPKQQYSGSLLRAREADPEAVARARAAERDLGIPAPLAERNPDEAERRRQESVYDRLFTEAPRAADWLSRGDNARIAHDDAEGLSAFEAAWNALRRGGGNVEMGYQQFRAERAAEVMSDRDRSLGEIIVDEAGGASVPDPFEVVGGVGRYLSSRLNMMRGADARAEAVGQFQEVGRIGERIKAIPMSAPAERAKAAMQKASQQGDTAAERVLSGLGALAEDPLGTLALAAEIGLESSPQLAAGGAVTALTRNPALGAASMGGVSGGMERYNSPAEFLQANGVDLSDPASIERALMDPRVLEAAQAYGITRAQIIGSFDAISGGVAAEQLMRSPLGNMLVQTFAQAGLGGAGEATAQLATTGEIDAAEVILEALGEFAMAPVEVVGVGGQYVRANRQARKAKETAAALGEAGAAAAASKLLQRDREAAREFFQTVAGDDGKLYVPLDQLQEVFGEDRQALTGLLRSWRVADQEAEARATGGDLVVDVGDFFTVADADYFQAITQRVRTAPGEWTLADAERYQQEAGDDLQAMVDGLDETGAVMAENATRQQKYAQILDDARRRLQSTGESLEASSAQAEVLARGLFTMAERLGVDPLAYAEQNMPEIVSDIRGRAPQVDDLDAVIERVRSGRRVRNEVKTPVLAVLRDRGGVRIGSRLAGEMESMGVTPRTRPGLFRREGGLTDADNIPLGEVDVLANAPDDGNGYVDPQYILDAVREELAGRPLTTQDQDDLAARLDAPADELEQILQDAGIDPAQASNHEIKDALRRMGAGPELEQADTSSEAFREWFGDSEVVDAEGEPLVVYHGTDAEFDAFDFARLGENTAGNASSEALLETARLGAWFSDQPDVADGMAADRTMQVYVSISAPAEFDSLASLAAAVEEAGSGELLRASLAADGYDGVAIFDEEMGGRSFIAFRPEQIKSVFNRGTFDPADPRILYQAQTARDIEAELEQDFPGVKLDLLDGRDAVTLSRIVVPEGARESGTGTAIMKRLAEWADASGKTLALTPSADFGGNKRRLTSFYKRFGFVENKGRNKNFSVNETMLREPRQLEQRKGGVRGSYNPSANVIRMTEARDLSTFLHESGHFYTFLLAREAARDGAPADVVADWQAVRDWWAGNAGDIRAEALRYAKGDEQAVADLEAMTDEQIAEFARTGDVMSDTSPLVRALHEQFARGFEAYLMEGKAPSATLREAFARFKAWLTRIYRDITRLNVTMSDDIRAVFDRLLATDAEVEQARQEMRYVDLDAEALGLTEAEASEATRLMERAAIEAREEVDRKIMREVARENERWWKEERAKVRSEIEPQVKRRPVYRAFQALAFGKTPEGDETAVRIKLNRAALVDAYGEDALKLLPRPYVYRREGGVHPDIAASMFGFANGDDLVKALWNMERMQEVIDRETDAVMIERHGDMMRDGTLEREAMEAAHNDAQARFLAVEYQAIQRRGGQGAPVQALREAARRIIRDRKTGDAIQPERYRTAEVKAAQAAERAAAEGDYRGAVREKARQILNHYLYREASTAREEVDGIVKYFGGFLNARKKWSGVDREYLDRIRSLLEAYNFGPRMSDKRRLRLELKAINDWLTAQAQDPDSMLVVPESILQDDQTEHYRDMPLGDLYALRDMVKSLHKQGRLKKRLLLEKEEREWTDYIEEIAGSVEAAVEPKAKFVETGDVRAQNPRLWERGFEAARGADAALIKIEQLAVWLDGGERGKFWNAVFKPMADAQARKYDLLKDFGGKVQAEFERMSPALKRWLHTERTYEVVGRRMTGSEVMALALNWGNEGNRDRVLLGYNWNDSQVTNVLEDMPADAWQHVQAIWDIVDGLYPHINEVHKRETGVDMPKVEAAPVMLRGREVAAGGYYPIMYDPRRSHQALQHEQERDSNSLFENNFIRPDTERGFTVQRENRVKRPVLLSLDALPRHLVNVTHYVSHYEAVKRVDRLLASNRMRQVITERFGPEYYRLFRPWLQAIGRDTADDGPAHLLDRVLGKLRLGMSVYAMGLKVTTALAQPAGIFTSVDDLGRRPDGSFSSREGLKWTVSGFKAVFGNGPRGIREAFRRADELSGELRHRMQTQDRELRQVLGQVVKGPRGNMIPAIQKAAFMHIAWVDKTVSVVTWYGAYNKALAENGGDPKAAADAADSTVRLTQSSGAIKDMATIQRGGETRRIFTMFYTYFSALYARLRDTGRTSVSRKDVPMAVARWAWLVSIPIIYDGMVKAALKGEFPWSDDEDEEDLRAFAEWFGVQNLLYPVTAVPFARDIVSGALDRYGYSLSPIDTFGETISRMGRSWMDDEADRDDIEEAIKAIGIGAGLPVGQVWNSSEYLFDYAAGNTRPENPLDFLQGLATGTPSDDKP